MTFGGQNDKQNLASSKMPEVSPTILSLSSSDSSSSSVKSCFPRRPVPIVAENQAMFNKFQKVYSSMIKVRAIGSILNSDVSGGTRCP